MKNHLSRRKFLTAAVGLPTLASTRGALNFQPTPPKKLYGYTTGLKTSLNAFCFNEPLLNGKMTINEVLDFCAATGFEGVDLTGYYFKGYPQVPSDEYLFQIKRQAFRLGLDISGTGIRNDFTIADKTKRDQEVVLVKNWIEVAAKIGAPVIFFDGILK
jgi:sugar phosphate isomerase/epimerase